MILGQLKSLSWMLICLIFRFKKKIEPFWTPKIGLESEKIWLPTGIPFTMVYGIIQLFKKMKNFISKQFGKSIQSKTSTEMIDVSLQIPRGYTFRKKKRIGILNVHKIPNGFNTRKLSNKVPIPQQLNLVAIFIITKNE